MIRESIPLLSPCTNFIVLTWHSVYNETQMIGESLPLLTP